MIIDGIVSTNLEQFNVARRVDRVAQIGILPLGQVVLLLRIGGPLRHDHVRAAQLTRRVRVVHLAVGFLINININIGKDFEANFELRT